jgi:hypothetical protein
VKYWFIFVMPFIILKNGIEQLGRRYVQYQVRQRTLGVADCGWEKIYLRIGARQLQSLFTLGKMDTIPP